MSKGQIKLTGRTINKVEAMEIFDKEAILISGDDVLPFHRAIDIFGEMAAAFIDENMKHEGYLKGGADWNAMGACSESRPIFYYFHRAGFLKLVTEYNYLLSVKEYKNSEGGRIFDRYMEERSKRLDAEDEKIMQKKRAKERKSHGKSKSERTDHGKRGVQEKDCGDGGGD